MRVPQAATPVLGLLREQEMSFYCVTPTGFEGFCITAARLSSYLPSLSLSLRHLNSCSLHFIPMFGHGDKALTGCFYQICCVPHRSILFGFLPIYSILMFSSYLFFFLKLANLVIHILASTLCVSKVTLTTHSKIAPWELGIILLFLILCIAL